MSFVLKESVPLETLGTSVDLYLQDTTGLRVVRCALPGPLCGATIVVATEARDDKGLPHTMEHAVFLGCRSVPYRGFLDLFATRCITTGTNAWTSEDYTAYTVTTAGPLGLLQILPVFLEHILFPTLSESCFATEVYHLDGEGREQGVVFCEMSGRENTEASLLNLHLNRALFPGTGYAYETGGLTPQIAQMTNEEVRTFHTNFYHPSNLSIIVTGDVDPAALFAALGRFPHLSESQGPPGWERPWSRPIPPLSHDVSHIVPFPSLDDSVGSIAYGWRGPPVQDDFTFTALDVLFRYLQETSASPLSRRFVERSAPLASSVGIAFKQFKETTFILLFGGVPLKRVHEEYNDRESDQSEPDDQDDEISTEEGGNESDSDGEEDMFMDYVYKKRLWRVFERLRDLGFPDGCDAMPRTVRRHRVKLLEGMEDDPADTVVSNLIPDMIFPERWKNQTLGNSLQVFPILDDLEARPDTFWRNLLDTWVIRANVVEIMMQPDPTLAQHISEEKVLRDEERVKTLGHTGLAAHGAALQQALEESNRPLPESVTETIPTVPPASSISALPVTINFVPSSPLGCPVQVVQLPTQFYHVNVCLHSVELPDTLRPFLLLFHCLLLETGMDIPYALVRKGGTGVLHIPFGDVVRQIHEETVTMFCGVGFDGETFNCSYLSEIFNLYGCSEPTKYALLCQWLSRALYFTTFTADRIRTMVTNLQRDLLSEKRDGFSMCEAISVVETEDHATSNGVAISVFRQEAFLFSLSSIMQSHEDHKIKGIIAKLNALRSILLSDASKMFIQICTPQGCADPLPSLCNALIAAAKSFWNHGDGPIYDPTYPPQPRFQLQAPTFPTGEKNFLVPISGVDSSYLEQTIPCWVKLGDPDYFPLLLLCEILSRSEGPIFQEIRGKGYAYDARVDLCSWTGQLSFTLFESSSPCQALSIFHDILRRVEDHITNPLSMDAARASLLYVLHVARSTAPHVIRSALRAHLLGFSSMEEILQYEQQLDLVDAEAVQNAYHRHFTDFLNPTRRITVVTTNPSHTPVLVEEFAKDPLCLSMLVREVKDFMIPLHE